VNLKEIIKDAFEYSYSDWKMLIILGLVLFIADLVDEMSVVGPFADEMSIALILAGLVLGMLEAGYLFRIVEESLNGSTKLPKFDKLKDMFVHGIKELVITVVYIAVPVGLFIAFYFWGLNLGMFTESFFDAFVWILIISFVGFTYIMFPAVILNMAHNHGNIKSGFDFKKILQKISNLGFKRLIVVYLGILIFMGLVEVLLSDNIKVIPVVGEVITDLIIAPYILVFTTRVLGLIDVP
jgi:hypothetical protein